MRMFRRAGSMQGLHTGSHLILPMNRDSGTGCRTQSGFGLSFLHPQGPWNKVQYETTVPTVLDRMVQQAVMQVLQGKWDRTFSEHSYGFRPGRSAHQAVEAAQQYIAAGNRWCVDLDLEKFFDRVNHDKLMAKIAERVSDKRLLKLIRAFLRAGV